MTEESKKRTQFKIKNQKQQQNTKLFGSWHLFWILSHRCVGRSRAPVGRSRAPWELGGLETEWIGNEIDWTGSKKIRNGLWWPLLKVRRLLRADPVDAHGGDDGDPAGSEDSADDADVVITGA